MFYVYKYFTRVYTKHKLLLQFNDHQTGCFTGDMFHTHTTDTALAALFCKFN